ncbi:MAG: hypothetical protein QF903_02765 [Planctomycetota bacterium]|jgi:hypothetical protein|nr:hypothetical protein [Planctomycetota bacterium]MDP6761244.1 hypothetical protein [Planctomycetota bacterium]MDP6988384.1 hypothetical protein [Planctomycetota bacterium]
MLTIVSDLLLTDCFLIKGNVENKYTRLSQVLDESRRYFLKVRDATLVDLKTCERVETPLLHVNLDEILLAHEFLDEGGDQHARLLASETELHRVRAFYTGRLNLEVAGQLRPGSYEADDRLSRRFFILRDPNVRGFDDHGDADLKGIGELPYVIVNKLRLSYIYDFN